MELSVLSEHASTLRKTAFFTSNTLTKRIGVLTHTVVNKTIQSLRKKLFLSCSSGIVL